MASFEGFIAHAYSMPGSQCGPRASLRLLAKPEHNRNESRNRVLLLMLVILLHIGFLVGLQQAMTIRRGGDSTVEDTPPMQATIIWETPLLLPVVKPTQRTPNLPAASAFQRPRALEKHALQVLPVSPQKERLPAMPAQPRVQYPKSLETWLDDPVQLRLPEVHMHEVTDPFARRPASSMLPGSDRVLVPGVQLRTAMTPQRALESVGALFGGGHFDPCPELEGRLLSASSSSERDELMDRYLRACPGR